MCRGLYRLRILGRLRNMEKSEIKKVDMITLVNDKPQDVIERIKTFADACEELGDKHPFVAQYCDNAFAYNGAPMTDDLIAFLKLRIITAALNEGWEPQFTEDETRWSSYYKLLSEEEYDELSAEDKSRVIYSSNSNGANECYGIVWSSKDLYNSFLCSVGSYRLYLKSGKLAAYAGRQFAEIYATFILGQRRGVRRKN